MPEKLLSSEEVAERLSITYRHFGRIEPVLIVEFKLERLFIGHKKRYTESSLDRLIRNAAKKQSNIKAVKRGKTITNPNGEIIGRV